MIERRDDFGNITRALEDHEIRTTKHFGRTGPAFIAVIEMPDGTMWVDNGTQCSQVNYCPIYGWAARVQIGEGEPAKFGSGLQLPEG